MTALAKSPWKQRFLFFTTGAIFASVCLFIQFEWMDIVPYAAFDQQPAWLVGLKQLVGWLPWMALAGVLVLRFMKGPRVRIGFYFLGTAAPLAVLLGWLFVGPSIANLHHRQEFDAALWHNHEKAEKDAMWPPRLCMVDDLLHQHEFKGMSREQLVALIGEPDKTAYFNDWDLVYWLGPERGFTRIDSEWLVFRLDGQKRITEHRIVTD